MIELYKTHDDIIVRQAIKDGTFKFKPFIKDFIVKRNEVDAACALRDEWLIGARIIKVEETTHGDNLYLMAPNGKRELPIYYNPNSGYLAEVKLDDPFGGIPLSDDETRNEYVD